MITDAFKTTKMFLFYAFHLYLSIQGIPLSDKSCHPSSRLLRG
jgi:hypothetical protein